MKLVIGLGNPGDKYNFTRHNFGFLALDFYAKIHQLKWEPHPKFNAIWLKSGDALFIKPQTFYNNVGTSVRAFMDFYKISPADIYVVCDDFNLDFGTLRHRDKGAAGGNNGLKSIIAQLISVDFSRLRLGTSNPEIRQHLGDVDFVLSRFTAEEKSALPSVLNTAASQIDQFLA